MITFPDNIISLVNKYSRWYFNIVTNSRERTTTPYKPQKGFERHHIIPKCFGGDDKKQNLVLLTYREHYLCHWLLTKMFEGVAKHKMQFAMMNMTRSGNTTRQNIPSWAFVVTKNQARAAYGSRTTRRGHKASEETKKKISESKRNKIVVVNELTQHVAVIDVLELDQYIDRGYQRGSIHGGLGGKTNGMWGKKHSEEARYKISKQHKGRKAWNKGIARDQQTRDKISAGRKGKKLSEEHKTKIALSRIKNPLPKRTPEQNQLYAAARKEAIRHKILNFTDDQFATFMTGISPTTMNGKKNAWHTFYIQARSGRSEDETSS